MERGYAKKVAYLLFIGPVPEGGCLAHNDYCKDHAFKACINPYHLVLTDQAGVMSKDCVFKIESTV